LEGGGLARLSYRRAGDDPSPRRRRQKTAARRRGPRRARARAPQRARAAVCAGARRDRYGTPVHRRSRRRNSSDGWMKLPTITVNLGERSYAIAVGENNLADLGAALSAAK